MAQPAAPTSDASAPNAPAPRDPAELRQRHEALQKEKGPLRARDAAAALGVTEAELVASRVGDGGVTRLSDDWDDFCHGLEALGEVMALTRNPHAVIEKTGIFRNVQLFDHGGNVLDEGLDLRIFRHKWGTAFAVRDVENQRRSIQIFGPEGLAYHKLFKFGAEGEEAFEAFATKFAAEDQSPGFVPVPAAEPPPEKPDEEIDQAGLLEAWSKIQDTHEFFFLFRRFKVSRMQALRLGGEFTRRVDLHSHRQILEWARDASFEIMVFVSSPGVIEIHTGTVKKLKLMGDWYNVLDKGFNLHLFEPGVAHAWVSKKPTADGIVTSLELYDEAGKTVALFFGKRKPGQVEQEAWREALAALPDAPAEG
ncbi:MAG: ChuX/HutX family heme-like substrate-binding protein [Myxococcota bacterium]